MFIMVIALKPIRRKNVHYSVPDSLVGEKVHVKVYSEKIVILYGKDGKFTLDGITLEQARKYKKEFWDNVNNKAHCSANVLQEKDVQDGEYNGSYVLVFNVPRAPRNKIPVYLHNNPENAFKRNYEGDYRCDASEIQRMFADADITEHPRDYKILPEFTIEQDIDKATLEQYRRLVATKSPDHPWLEMQLDINRKEWQGLENDYSGFDGGITLPDISRPEKQMC